MSNGQYSDSATELSYRNRLPEYRLLITDLQITIKR